MAKNKTTTPKDLLQTAIANAKAKKLIDYVNEALDYQADAWEADESINGAELVDYFGEWRKRVKRILGRDERELNGMRLSKRELATVLAALRYFSANLDDIDELDMDHFKDVKRLSAEQIRRLCERINQ